MTSANVIEYRIEKNKKIIGNFRQNILCKSRLHELLKFMPLSKHVVTPYGYDEEEEYWEGDPENLEIFLKGCVRTNKEIKDYFEKNP